MIPLGDGDKPAAGAPAGLSSRTCSDRAVSAEETWARIEPLLRPHGITRMARMTGLDRIGIPVWNAIMPNARSLAVSQGKGVTDMDAKVSAAMEGLERAIAGSPWPHGILTSAQALAAEGRPALLLPELTAAQAADLQPQDMTTWTEAEELGTGRVILVPFAAAALDCVLPDSDRYWQSSDGLASGNTSLEARFHGLMERVERDAECLFHFLGPAERAATVLDHRVFADNVLEDLLARIEDAGLRPMLFDMTSDIGIPVILCHIGPSDISTRRHVTAVEIVGGAGAHPDPARAAIRAVTEAAQSRITFISGTRDDIDDRLYRQPPAAWIREAFELPARARPNWRPPPAGLRAMLDHTLDRLEAVSAGPVIAVRLSDPALPVTVEKIIVPRLENPPGHRLRPFGARALLRAVGP